jgi:hypothetical protein
MSEWVKAWSAPDDSGLWKPHVLVVRASDYQRLLDWHRRAVVLLAESVPREHMDADAWRLARDEIQREFFTKDPVNNTVNEWGNPVGQRTHWM